MHPQSHLVRRGYVVVPILDSLDAVRKCRALVMESFVGSPELHNPDPDDPEWKPMLGGFAAAAHPSSSTIPTCVGCARW